MLRGLGAAVALPWLDSMVPALTALAKHRRCSSPSVRGILRTQRNGAAVLAATGRGFSSAAAADAAHAGGVQRSGLADWWTQRRRRRSEGQRWRSFVGSRHFPQWRGIPGALGRERDCLYHDGSDRGEGICQGDADRFSRARDGVGLRHRRMRNQLRLDQYVFRGVRPPLHCRSTTTRVPCSNGCSA